MVEGYLIGCLISCPLWFLLIKLRQKGFNIPFPKDSEDLYILEPLNNENVNLRMVMVGWLCATFFWYLVYPIIICVAIGSYLVFGIKSLCGLTIGNDKLLTKIFGVKK
ncbi:hypothetical protein [Escherichia phage vB_EcoM-LTH01]